jgi:AbrB family looped-hinge helix DNA binding protein
MGRPAKIHVAKVSSKGQLTIPLAVREALKLKAGDKLIFTAYSNGRRIELWKALFEGYPNKANRRS